jgi:hypothetical protein
VVVRLASRRGDALIRRQEEVQPDAALINDGFGCEKGLAPPKPPRIPSTSAAQAAFGR